MKTAPHIYSRIILSLFVIAAVLSLPVTCLAGAISGTVTDNNSTPLADVIVHAYSDHCQNGYLGEATTDSTGTYSISGIPDGTQAYLWADSVPTGQNLTQEWYDGVNGIQECGLAQPVDDGASGVDFVLEIAGSITGTIRDAGNQPIFNMHIYATVYGPQNCNDRWLAAANTDANGFYRIDHIPPGNVVIHTCAECNGLDFVNEYHDDTLNCWEATVIPVVAGNTASGYDFQLATGGSVSGHVYDDGGQLLANVHVYARSEGCYGLWLGGTNTDENGFYRIAGLPPGPVFLRTNAPGNGLNYVDESWDNAPDCNAATEIVVEAGEETPNTDFNLSPGGSISGFVYEQGTTNPIPGINVNIYTDRCHNGHQYGLQTDDTGYFEFIGLPVGAQYILRADSSSSDQYFIGQWYDGVDDTQDCNSATFLTVGETIVFNMAVGGYITGMVTDTGANPIQNLWMEAFTGQCWNNWSGGAWTDENGDYRIGPLAPGDYYVFACPHCSGHDFVEAWWDADQGAYNCNEAHSVNVIAEQNAGPVNFTLNTWSSISGTITGYSDVPLPGVTVEAFYDCYDWFAGSAVTDENGDYTIEGLPEGDYLIKINGIFYNGVQYPESWLDGDTCQSSTRVHVDPEQQLAGTDVPVEPGFALTGSVMNVQNPDGTFQTNIEVTLDDYDADYLPADVTGIDIRLHRPDGSTTLLASYPSPGWTYYPQWKDFGFVMPGMAEVGFYEIEVTTAYATEVGRDYQAIIRTIPMPDSQTFAPGNGEILASTTPVFSWAPVVMDDPDAPPLFYRLEVADMSGDRVWASGRTESMTSCAVPAGKLQEGQNYQWRVRVSDSGDWVETQNRVNSQWVPFSMAGALSHGAAPAISLDQYGAATWSGNGYSNLDLWIQVIDQDGVAFDGSSHQVTVTTPDGDVADLNFNYARGPVGYYSRWEGNYLAPGTYTFTVADSDGNVASVQDDLGVNPILPPDETSISPSNMDEYITATFDNVNVNGSPYDDFSDYPDIGGLDPNKWNSPYGCGAIVADALQFDLSGTVGREDCGLSFVDPSSVDTIQTDITIHSLSSNDAPRARIYGLYYFNGHGDVSGVMNVKGDRIYYGVYEEILSNGVYSWKTLAEDILMTVTPGQTVTVSIDWDGSTLTFAAADAANPMVVSSYAYTAPGLVAPPNIGDLRLLQVRTNLVTPDTTPTFSWDPVAGAQRYRLRIYDSHGQRTLWRGYTAETSCTVPPGVLQPDSYYQFRVQAYSNHSPMETDNTAGTDKYRFYTASAESPVPSIEFDSHGVFTWNGDSTDPYIYFWVKVHDAQGVPGNIKSVKVQFPGNGQILELDHNTSRDPSPTSGYYENEALVDPTGMDGQYIFIVEDWDGNIYETTEELTVDPIGYPDPGTFDAVVNGTALDVDWDEVLGAAFYRLEIYDEDFNRIHVFATTDSQYSVPEGVFKANAAYRYRITTRREFFDQNVDNGSSSPWDDLDYPVFLTFDVDDNADGDVDGMDLAAFAQKIRDKNIVGVIAAVGEFAKLYGRMQ